MKRVFRQEGLEWPTFYLGYDYSVPDQYGVEGYPTMIVLDQEMRIRSVGIDVDVQTIEALLKTEPE